MPRGVSRHDEARLQGRLWTPKIHARAVRYWVDAQRRNHGMTGSSLNALADATDGNGQPLSSNPGGTRRWSDAGLNGRPAFDFQGGCMFSASYPIGLPGVGSDFIAAAVFTLRSGSAAQYRLMMIGAPEDWNSTASMSIFMREAAGVHIQTFANSSLRLTTSMTYDEPTLMVLHSKGGTMVHRKNGSQTASASYTPAFSSSAWGFGIGTYSAADLPASYYDGLVGEQTFIAGTFGTPQVEQLEGYLAHRWGLQERLATSHPYRNTPPLIGG